MKKESRNLKSITEKTSNIGIVYGIREHKNTLKQSLNTKKYINEKQFKELLNEYYHYYGYDERCNQLLFILNDMITKPSKPVWLFIELINLNSLT